MLDVLPPIAELVLAGSKSLLADTVKDASLRASETLVRTHEPSTLALALVGIATVAIYFAASGFRRSKSNQTSEAATQRGRAVPRESGQRTADVPKRGAA